MKRALVYFSFFIFHYSFGQTWHNLGTGLTDIITASIQNQGAVEVFLSIDGGTTWNSIPTTHVGATLNAFWAYQTQVGLVQVTFEWNDQGADGDPNTTYSATCEIKVVLIAPAAIKKHPNTNWKDYSQVKAIMDVQNMVKQ